MITSSQGKVHLFLGCPSPSINQACYLVLRGDISESASSPWLLATPPSSPLSPGSTSIVSCRVALVILGGGAFDGKVSMSEDSGIGGVQKGHGVENLIVTPQSTVTPASI